MSCQNINLNKEQCSCVYTTCERHGVCCQCISYHRKNGDLPGCLRKNAK
ncbi:MAG TPA: DUF6485 family protein [Bacillota bacterium]|nr:DUF6485 family protein [Bacillota bacterium]HPO97541.1 DUF6485 family protein [Bacillota bacterium]